MAQKSPNSMDKYVGSRVRMRRLILGMSQVKLGALLGVTFQQVQKYEKGTNRIGASRLQRMAEILGVPISFFFEDIPEVRRQESAEEAHSTAFAPDYVSGFLASTQGLALSKAFMDIRDPQLRRRVVDLVEEIANGSRQST